MSRRLTTEEFKRKINEIYGDQFEILSDYVNNNTKISLRCKKCGNVIQKRPVKMVGSAKEGCYICSGKNRYKTKETLQQEIDRKYPGEYEILGEYIRANEPISVKRISCGHTYNASPDNLLRGKGCPKCSLRQSRYMDIVEEYLRSRKIEFVKEKCFSDCKSIRVLPFDYYLPYYNTCIEVDGKFHYPRNSIYINKESAYEKVAARDKIKTSYCKQKGINLIRLAYFDKSRFFNILDQKLHVNTETTLLTSKAGERCNA